MHADSYKSIAKTALGEYKEKGSKFLAYAIPISKEEDIKSALEKSRKEHPKARHHCYAYRIGKEGKLYRANDDGEPSGTAGKPILGQLLSAQLSDTLIIVVRYFGGTKLGASGLINAYKAASVDAISNCTTIEKTIMTDYVLEADFSIMGKVMEVFKKQKLIISKKEFSDKLYLEFSFPISEAETSIVKLKAGILQKSIEEITDKTVIPACKIYEKS